MDKKMTYRCLRFLGFGIIVLSLAVSGLAKAKKPCESFWPEEPVIIDGMNIDWQDIQLEQHDKLKIEYGFKNDDRYLYAVFTFNDLNFLSSIDSSGMTLWLNNTRKKKKNYGIKFKRQMITPERFIAILESQRGPLPEEQKKEMMKRKFFTIYLNGVVEKDPETMIPIKVASDQAPAFKVSQTPQMMVYEFRIPLKNEEGQVVGIGTSPGGEIVVCFEWGGMTPEVKAEMIKKRGYRGSSATGGVSSDMPGSDESEGVSDSGIQEPSTAGQFARMKAPKKYSIWVPLKLAEKK